MIALTKGLLPGILLTWIVASLIAAGGSTGGFLHIFDALLWSYPVDWSWPLFLAATGLASGIFKLME